MTALYLLVASLLSLGLTVHARVECTFNHIDEAHCRYDFPNNWVAQWHTFRMPEPRNNDPQPDMAMGLRAENGLGYAVLEILDVPMEASCLSFEVNQNQGGFYRILTPNGGNIFSDMQITSGMESRMVNVTGTNSVRFEGTVAEVHSYVTLDNIRVDPGMCGEVNSQADVAQSSYGSETPDDADQGSENDGAPTTRPTSPPPTEVHPPDSMQPSIDHAPNPDDFPLPPPNHYEPRHPNDNFPPAPNPPGTETLPQPQPLDPRCPEPLRLSGGTSTSGRVEMCHDGEWGTVCEDGWTGSNSKVICKTLGFSDGERIPVPDDIPELPIFLDGLRCHGYHRFLHQCCYNEIGVHDCQHYQDVALRCYYDVPSPAPCSSRDPSCRPSEDVGQSNGPAPPQGPNDGTQWQSPPSNPVDGIEEPIGQPDNIPAPAPQDGQDPNNPPPPQGPSDGSHWSPPPAGGGNPDDAPPSLPSPSTQQQGKRRK